MRRSTTRDLGLLRARDDLEEEAAILIEAARSFVRGAPCACSLSPTCHRCAISRRLERYDRAHAALNAAALEAARPR